MAITKPYTFQAGTKARASEVNQDFDILYSEVNRIGTEILNIDIDIQNVDEGKADINGNAGQVFKMADAVDSYDGVNKNFLENAIANVKDYISGYIITKDTDTSIIVSSGSCYDSTFTVVINSTSNITKENTTQSANTIYYIYAISDSSGYNVDILISQSGINPPLPSGYTLFRQIGMYKTDGNSKIEYIYQHNSTTPEVKATIIDTYVNGTSGYNVYSNGYCEQWGFSGQGNPITVTLLKTYKNSNYSILFQQRGSGGGYEYNNSQWVISVNNGSFSYRLGYGDGLYWRTCGYIA